MALKRWLGRPVALGWVFLTYFGVFLALWVVWQIGKDTEKFACQQAEMIAWVPALQFEGEPLRNFVGWINARAGMLEVLRADTNCSDRVESLLENRVRLDHELLEELTK